MYLGLLDGSFVSHKLLSAHEGPVPLPKFQMAPCLKILMSSGSKKRTQIYYPFSLKKTRQVNPLQIPQRGPYGQRHPLTRSGIGVFFHRGRSFLRAEIKRVYLLASDLR